jgi:hypothetical protein
MNHGRKAVAAATAVQSGLRPQGSMLGAACSSGLRLFVVKEFRKSTLEKKLDLLSLNPHRALAPNRGDSRIIHNANVGLGEGVA